VRRLPRRADRDAGDDRVARGAGAPSRRRGARLAQSRLRIRARECGGHPGRRGVREAPERGGGALLRTRHAG
jgi:hypothetical protein